MIAQFQVDELDRTIAPPKTYFHHVTLIKRSTGEEVSFTIETDTERFKDVLDVITWQRAERGLFGYEIFEVLPDDLPF